MKMNNLMACEYEQLRDRLPGRLPSELLAIIDEGFVTAEGGCIFSRFGFRHKGNAMRSMFPDDVGYECFVNHLHIDDFTDNNFLATGILMVEQWGALWRRSGLPGSLRVLLSNDDDSCTVTFHLIRENQEWLNPDLDSYAQAILVMDFCEGEQS